MAPYPFQGYAPPVYQHTAQPYMVPAHPVVMQPVHMHPVLVHPAPPILVRETWTTPGELLPLPKWTPRRQRSGREEFEAYGYTPPQSKPKDRSRTYDQHRARIEQPLHQKQAIGSQAQKQIDERAYWSDDAMTIVPGPEISSDRLDENGKETKKPTSSQRVHTKGERLQEWCESLPHAPDEQPKGNSIDPAGTRRKPTTEKSQSAQPVHTNNDTRKLRHAQEHIGPQSDGADKQAKGAQRNRRGPNESILRKSQRVLKESTRRATQLTRDTLKRTSSLNRTLQTNKPRGAQHTQQELNQSVRRDIQLVLHMVSPTASVAPRNRMNIPRRARPQILQTRGGRTPQQNHPVTDPPYRLWSLNLG